MKQAQELQAKMAEMQEKMLDMEAEGVSGGGMVKVIVNGKGEAKALEIDESLLNKEDKEVLEDLLVAAFNDAKAKVDQKTQDEMKHLTGGMKLPFGF